MTRFVTKVAAATAAMALVSVPGIAMAQTTQAVDEKTGPVSFANVASVRIGNSGSLITETQRSPLTPGQSKLSPDRTTVPRDAGEKKTLGGNWEINLGRYGAQSPYPKGIASRDQNVLAALQQTTVPTAVAETNYALIDYGRGKSTPAENTVLVLQGAKTAVDCNSPKKASSSSTVSKVWVRNGDGQLQESGSAGLQVNGLRLGPPSTADSEKDKISRDTTTSDVTLSRVTAFDQLVRQDGWRSGDVTAAAGWKLDIVTHVRDAASKDLREARTTIVLGGVSCSIPRNFVAKPAGGPGAGAPAQQPAVPGTVPAGGVPPQGADSSRMVLGLGLLGGGIVFGAAAMLLYRRRKPVLVREQ